MKHLKYLVLSIFVVFIFSATSFAQSPSGQGVFITSSTGNISNPVNNGSWALLPSGAIDAYYGGVWNAFTAPVTCSGLPALTGDATSSAGSCATTVGGIGGVSITPTTNSSASGSVTLNMATNRFFRLILIGNITSMTCSTPVSGITYQIKIKQGSGPYTVSWCSQVDWGSAGTPTLTVTNAKWDLFNCSYDGITSTLNCGVAGQGFSN